MESVYAPDERQDTINENGINLMAIMISLNFMRVDEVQFILMERRDTTIVNRQRNLKQFDQFPFFSLFLHARTFSSFIHVNKSPKIKNSLTQRRHKFLQLRSFKNCYYCYFYMCETGQTALLHAIPSDGI